MRIIATVEARMSSSRFPGKVLMPVLGEPALSRLVERLRRVKQLDGIVIATTVNTVDDPIADLARRIGVESYRGSEEDVMGRVIEAARSVRADVIAEVTGDCTLLAPEVIEEAVTIYRQGGCDVASNTWKPSYPQGVDAQVFAASLLAEAYAQTTDPVHREHVSLAFYENQERYRIHHMTAPEPFRAPDARFQLDYPQDLQFIRAVYEALYPGNPVFSLKEIFQLLRTHPHLKTINAGVSEKPLRVAA
jgi:spore coat polysaccharide biosynthesis protein SpsF